MIPKIIPPLTGLTVLVTRPAPQAAVLCEEIARRGGTALAFPAIAIEPLTPDTALQTPVHDLVVFVSVNAVAHGAHLVTKDVTTRIAAIGKATAAALADRQLPADIVPAAGFTSEDLLTHPDLALSSTARILIVRGEGGRELMHETFAAQGMAVESMTVYRRVQPPIDEAKRAQLEAMWAEDGIDVVTVTSIETLVNLSAMLSERGRELLRSTPLVVPSRRIMDAALQAGLHADVLVAGGADDASMIGTLAAWHGRARGP